MIVSHIEIIAIDILDQSAIAIRCTDNLGSFKASRWSALTGHGCARTTQAAVPGHYGDVIMGVIASQITSLTTVYSTVYSDADQRKHQSSASLAFVRVIYRWPMNSPHKWPVTRKMFPFDGVIMVYPFYKQARKHYAVLCAFSIYMYMLSQWHHNVTAYMAQLHKHQIITMKIFIPVSYNIYFAIRPQAFVHSFIINTYTQF